MPINDPRNISWNAANQARRFPLMFDCNPVSEDGLFRIPDELITALYISHNIDSTFLDPTRFFVDSIIYFRTGFTVSVSYAGAADAVIKVAETTVDIVSAPAAKTVPLLGVTRAFLNGMLVLGDIQCLEKMPIGEWHFTPESTTLDPFCIRYVASEITELYVRKLDRSVLGPFFGTVVLSEGDNIRFDVRNADLSCLELPINGATDIIINAVPEDTEIDAVKTINGVGPDSTGNLFFEGSDCLSIMQKGPHTLEFSDKCAEPCCSCTELVPIEEKALALQRSIELLSSRIETLINQNNFISHSLSTLT
ncbi:hypothetical protein FACS1894214_0210 [Planctomycetales bacterium]|nr:hypothetical protein FACS1894214_0210 [Planctomycetales bacterium]